MPVTFTGPDGKDPVAFATKVFHDATSIPETRLKKLGTELALRITQRTADGMSYTGEEFTKYVATYARQKNSSDVDLYGVRDDEHMMDELQVWATGEPPVITIGFPDGSPKAALARIHNEGSHIRVAAHIRGGKQIPSFLRKKKIRGFTSKGGRAVHGMLPTGFITKTYERKLPTQKIKVWVHKNRTLKLGFRNKSFVDVTSRIAVRSRKITKFVKRSETRTLRIPQFAKGILYRNPVNAVIPARPFLGLTAEDQSFVERNILPPQQKGK